MSCSLVWCYRLSLVLVIAIAGCAAEPTESLPPEELEAMRRAAHAYSEAWLSNDPEAVMATFVDEPVLSPSGLAYKEGQEAAREFWWPVDSPSTTVTRFEVEELEASGSGNLGFVRGTYTLVFDYDGKSYTNRGKSLHILKKTSESGWRISHHFWNDLPAQ